MPLPFYFVDCKKCVKTTNFFISIVSIECKSVVVPKHVKYKNLFVMLKPVWKIQCV